MKRKKPISMCRCCRVLRHNTELEFIGVQPFSGVYLVLFNCPGCGSTISRKYLGQRELVVAKKRQRIRSEKGIAA